MDSPLGFTGASSVIRRKVAPGGNMDPGREGRPCLKLAFVKTLDGRMAWGGQTTTQKDSTGFSNVVRGLHLKRENQHWSEWMRSNRHVCTFLHRESVRSLHRGFLHTAVCARHTKAPIQPPVCA